MKGGRLRLPRRALLLVAPALIAAPARAWPLRPVRIILPYSAGGGTDMFARLVAEALTNELGQPFVVENRTGANGVVGTNALARAAPDGHTLAVVATTHVLNKYVMRDVPFDPLRDFTPVMRLARTVYIVVGSNRAPFDSLGAMVEHARRHPGTISVGHSEASTAYASRLLQRMAGVRFVDVPYRGGGQMMPDVVSGTINAAMTGSGTSRAFIEQGQMRGIAVGTPNRSPQLPQVPTIHESFPGYDYGGWYGLLGPAGLPSEIVERLSTTITRLMQQEPLRGRLVHIAGNLDFLPPAGFREFLEAENQTWIRALAAGEIAAE